jgi:hypothetical protein
MRNIKKYNILAFLTLSLVAGIFSNTPSLYAQGGNQTGTTTTMQDSSMANMTQTTPVAESPDNDDYKEDDEKK